MKLSKKDVEAMQAIVDINDNAGLIYLNKGETRALSKTKTLTLRDVEVVIDLLTKIESKGYSLDSLDPNISRFYVMAFYYFEYRLLGQIEDIGIDPLDPYKRYLEYGGQVIEKEEENLYKKLKASE